MIRRLLNATRVRQLAVGRPIWTSQVRPGREHDTTAVRVHAEILPALAAAAGSLQSLGDLGLRRRVAAHYRIT